MVSHLRFCMLSLTLSVVITTRAGAATDANDVGIQKIVARFDNRNPHWQVRMRSLVEIAKRGADAVPILIETLERGTPASREFAAQALEVLADPQARPALTKAVEDTNGNVRIYAVRALSRLSSVALTDRQQRALKKGAGGRLRHYIASVLLRKGALNPKEMRQALASYDLTRMSSARLGHPAPDFVLKEVDGRRVKLSDFRGKKTILLEFNVGDN